MKMTISSIYNETIGKVDMSSLEDRITFQKVLYILKELGAIKENFPFGWYIFGPYSSEITKIGFDFVERGIDREVRVSDDFWSKITKFKELAHVGKIESNKWLELLASMHYLIKYRKLEKAELFIELSKHKSYFNNRELLEKAFKVLNSNLFESLNSI